MDKVWCLLTGVMLLILGRCSVKLPDPPVHETEEYAQAAQTLCAVICAAAPADYTWDPGRGESEDFDWAVRYSCRDGHALAEY